MITDKTDITVTIMIMMRMTSLGKKGMALSQQLLLMQTRAFWHSVPTSQQSFLALTPLVQIVQSVQKFKLQQLVYKHSLFALHVYRHLKNSEHLFPSQHAVLHSKVKSQQSPQIFAPSIQTLDSTHSLAEQHNEVLEHSLLVWHLIPQLILAEIRWIYED